VNEWLAAQGRPALPPPAAGAPTLHAKPRDALDGPVGAALALLVTLAASMGGGVVAALFGTAPLASLAVMTLIFVMADADGAGAARAASVRAALARHRP
jgi:hypothetical protein